MIADIDILVDNLIKGQKAALGKCITLVESTLLKHKLKANAILKKVMPLTGNSIRIGITGVPGVGKSTFVETLGMYYLSKGYRVAVLAIDPTSVKNKGSILGDKTRMNELSTHKDAFIRPSASGGSLGGVANNTRESILLCEAAGYDVIIIETVGVGQSEVAVHAITDMFILLMLSGAGDELQGIKRGIMEMCDAMVITKADGDNVQAAKMARSEYARALHFLPPNTIGWTPKVLTASALEAKGIGDVYSVIRDYKEHQLNSNAFQQKRTKQNVVAYKGLVSDHLLNLILADEKLNKVIEEGERLIALNKSTPYIQATNVLEHIRVALTH